MRSSCHVRGPFSMTWLIRNETGYGRSRQSPKGNPSHQIFPFDWKNRPGLPTQTIPCSRNVPVDEKGPLAAEDLSVGTRVASSGVGGLGRKTSSDLVLIRRRAPTRRKQCAPPHFQALRAQVFTSIRGTRVCAPGGKRGVRPLKVEMRVQENPWMHVVQERRSPVLDG